MFRLGTSYGFLLPAALILYLSLAPSMSAEVSRERTKRSPDKVLERGHKALEFPNRFGLEQNSPNPFKSSTSVGYIVRISNKPMKVTIEILDASGRCVRTLVDDLHNPGQYSFCWRGTDDNGEMLSSGTYFCRLRADDREATREVVIAK